MGTCGCCTVIIDGKPILSCLTLAAQVEDKEIIRALTALIPEFSRPDAPATVISLRGGSDS